jgi:acetyl esterase/lipase
MAPEPVIRRPLPLLTRVNYALRLWLFKAFVVIGLRLFRTIKARSMKQTAPTYTKRYNVRPMLENRVFIPSTWQAGTKLPLYIDIHGGGFAICDPQTDDQFCHRMANKYGFCVVSINYRKAPTVPFPDLVYDAAEVARAVLADPDLPVDHSKVVGGGFSAGGNLILAISQMEGLRGQFRAVVPIYPVVDFSGAYKGSYRPMPDGTKDALWRSSSLFSWGYISAGEDLTNPLLSPIYAPKESLPLKIFFVGAEYDYLCHEANIMAKKLSGSDGDCTIQDSNDWSRNGIKWRIVLDVQHGFTHVKSKGDKEIRRKEICDRLYAEIAQWLKDEVLS